jgi:hypothetical protein
MRQWFLNVLVGLLEKIVNTDLACFYENTYESRIRIPLWLTISVIGRFSPRDHLPLDRGKVGLNIHAWAFYGTVYRIKSGFRSEFYSNRRLSECRNIHFIMRVTGRIDKISKCFQRSKEILTFDYLSN